MEQAIEFEARRQIEILEDGGTITQETRLYDPDRNETRSMRTKEDAQDYRYFPDPDLLPLVISEKEIEAVRVSMPELPEAMRDRLVREYGVTKQEADLLTSTKGIAEYYVSATKRLLELDPQKRSRDGTLSEDARRTYGRAIAKGVVGLLAAQLNRDSVEIENARVTPAQFAVLHARHIDNTLSAKSARDVFQTMWESPSDSEDAIDAVIEVKGLTQISDSGEIEKIVDEVLAANAKQVADYRAGREKAFNSLVGQVMKASKGKANPAQVNEILRRKLKG
jgi:aspartyl-tRNA(Asn)/glutamyl-tRNA(Gln) amidotransferase subunit B